MSMPAEPKTVVIAMSGGVDSSVAAAILLEQGYRVIGMMLRLWSAPGSAETNRCCTPDAMAQARRVAAQLGIPFYAIDAQQPFYHHVVEYFLDSYSFGDTPNPCMICNRKVRWSLLLDHARLMGADALVTGHYARIRPGPDGKYQLLRGLDANKDQSYVLSGLTQEQLAHTIWPLGELTKPVVRERARQLGLVVAERPESQDLCFLGDGDYHSFLQTYRPDASQPGPIVDLSGRVLGQHDGLPNYTIGQRKGLRIAAPQPFYVLRKNAAANTLIVGTRQDLGASTCEVTSINWIAGSPPAGQFNAQIKIRYKSEPAAGWVQVSPDGQHARVRFEHPLRDITPGQFAVFYDGEIVLGGGMIQVPTIESE